MGIVKVAHPDSDPGPYAADRRCADASCITVLRRTNPGPYCEQCSKPMVLSVDHRTALVRMEMGRAA